MLDQITKPDFNWIIQETRQMSIFYQFDSAVIMSNQGLVKLRCLYESEMLNQLGEDFMILIDNFAKRNSREFNLEIGLNESEILFVL